MVKFPLSSVAKRIVRVTFGQLTKTQRGRQALEVLCFEGLKFLGVGSGGYLSSSGEEIVTDLLKNRLPASGPLTLFDVGANQGQTMEMIADGLKDVPYRLHCFEPSSATFTMLQKAVGNRPHISLNNIGLGITAGEFELFSDETGSGLASLSKRRLDHFNVHFDQRETVRLDTLDNYCQTQGIDQIDLLKIDVEGHEMDVLKGGARMFAEQRVKMVTFEFGGTDIDSRTFFQDFYYFFQEHRMTGLYRILPGGRLYQIDRYVETLEQFQTCNYLVLDKPIEPAADTIAHSAH